MGCSGILSVAVVLAATAVAAQTQTAAGAAAGATGAAGAANKTSSASVARTRTATVWSAAFSSNSSKPGDMVGQSSIKVKQPLKRKVEFDADFAKYLGLASQDQSARILAPQGGVYKVPLAYDGSREALRALVELPRALIGSTPASYAYFMQMHPAASDSLEEDEKSIRFVHHPQPSHGGRLKSNSHAPRPFKASSQKRHQFREHPEPDRVRPFKSQFASSVHFPSHPFTPIEVPTTFTHGNPLAKKKFNSRKRVPVKSKNELVVENHFAEKDVPRELFNRLPSGKNAFADLELKNVPFRLGSTRNQLDTEPHYETEADGSDSRFAKYGGPPGHGPHGPHGPGKSSHFKNFQGTTSTRLTGPTGFGTPDSPDSPTVREYDPYTTKFRVVATADSNDSKERYKPPMRDRYSPPRHPLAPVAPLAHAASDEEVVSREADVNVQAPVRPGFYEVRENEHQEHQVDDYTDPDCRKKSHKNALVTIPYPQSHIFFGSPLKKSPPKGPYEHHHSPMYDSSAEKQLTRYHHKPTSRPEIIPGYRLPLRDASIIPEPRANSTEQRVPIFEFKNPVHSLYSGYATDGPSAHDDVGGVTGPEEVLSGHGENIEDTSSAELQGDERAEQEQDQQSDPGADPGPDHLREGEAEAEALDEEDEKKLFPQEEEKLFGSFEVFQSQLEPNKGDFKPFVRFPFEVERGKLKTMVDDLLKVG